jgi:poly(3-hydroxybutyrate) depolymerase
MMAMPGVADDRGATDTVVRTPLSMLKDTDSRRPSFSSLAIVVLATALCAALLAQAPDKRTFDETIPPGSNFDKAEFRLWCPPSAGPLRAVLVLVPGSNGDGRGDVMDRVWQDFATRNRLALVGCRLTDKPHEQGFIEEYADASKGTGQALLTALGALGRQALHAELSDAPLLLWGMSAGGQFNYEFVAWKPERVAAFVVNKGGIYYSALVPRAARNVPGLLFVGGKDLWSRNNTISGLFAVNRRAGALWALAEEPGAAHVVGRSRDVALVFFEDVLRLRLDSTNPGALKPIPDGNGFVGDLAAKTFKPMADAAAVAGPTVWLPTERAARAWQAMLQDQPFEK